MNDQVYVECSPTSSRDREFERIVKLTSPIDRLSG